MCSVVSQWCVVCCAWCATAVCSTLERDFVARPLKPSRCWSWLLVGQQALGRHLWHVAVGSFRHVVAGKFLQASLETEVKTWRRWRRGGEGRGVQAVTSPGGLQGLLPKQGPAAFYGADLRRHVVPGQGSTASWTGPRGAPRRCLAWVWWAVLRRDRLFAPLHLEPGHYSYEPVAETLFCPRVMRQSTETFGIIS